MPWTLTSAISTGGLDAVSMYASVHIVRVVHNPTDRYLNVEIEYGNFSGPAWVKGALPVGSVKSYAINGTAYTSVLAANPVGGESAYNGLMRAVYLHLATQGAIPAGTYSGAS